MAKSFENLAVSSSQDLTYCVSSLLLWAILVAVVFTDALGFLATEHKPGDMISTSSCREALNTFHREWLPYLHKVATAPNIGFCRCQSQAFSLTPHYLSVLRSSFHEL